MAHITCDEIAATVRRRQPACGSTRVVAIDGPSGAGKSVLADQLGAELASVVVRVDELVPGWRGLSRLSRILVDHLLGPIAATGIARVQRWDWANDGPGEIVTIAPGPMLVLDGCGSGSRLIRPYLSLLLWVDAPPDARYERAMSRDGDDYGPWWDVWAEQERTLYAAEGTEGAADLRLRSG